MQQWKYHLLITTLALCVFAVLAFTQYKVYRLGFADGYNWCMMQGEDLSQDNLRERSQE